MPIYPGAVYVFTCKRRTYVIDMEGLWRDCGVWDLGFKKVLMEGMLSIIGGDLVGLDGVDGSIGLRV